MLTYRKKKVCPPPPTPVQHRAQKCLDESERRTTRTFYWADYTQTTASRRDINTPLCYNTWKCKNDCALHSLPPCVGLNYDETTELIQFKIHCSDVNKIQLMRTGEKVEAGIVFLCPRSWPNTSKHKDRPAVSHFYFYFHPASSPLQQHPTASYYHNQAISRKTIRVKLPFFAPVRHTDTNPAQPVVIPHSEGTLRGDNPVNKISTNLAFPVPARLSYSL